MNEPKEYTLKVGENAKVKSGFMTSYSLVYAGMLSDYIFSIAVTWSSGNNSAAYNLYFEKGQREIKFLNGRLTVRDVSKSEIRFVFQK
jgi:hypothetical protein